jgi:hypothetical protein
MAEVAECVKETGTAKEKWLLAAIAAAFIALAGVLIWYELNMNGFFVSLSMSQRLCGASKIYIDLKGFPEEWKACDFATFITAFSKGVEITLADAFYYIVLRICLQSRNNRL